MNYHQVLLPPVYFSLFIFHCRFFPLETGFLCPGSCFVDQVGLKLREPPECWHFRSVPPSPSPVLVIFKTTVQMSLSLGSRLSTPQWPICVVWASYLCRAGLVTPSQLRDCLSESCTEFILPQGSAHGLSDQYVCRLKWGRHRGTGRVCLICLPLMALALGPIPFLSFLLAF